MYLPIFFSFDYSCIASGGVGVSQHYFVSLLIRKQSWIITSLASQAKHNQMKVINNNAISEFKQTLALIQTPVSLHILTFYIVQSNKSLCIERFPCETFARVFGSMGMNAFYLVKSLLVSYSVNRSQIHFHLRIGEYIQNSSLCPYTWLIRQPSVQQLTNV